MLLQTKLKFQVPGVHEIHKDEIVMKFSEWLTAQPTKTKKSRIGKIILVKPIFDTVVKCSEQHTKNTDKWRLS